MVYDYSSYTALSKLPQKPYISEVYFKGKKLKVKINPKNSKKHELKHILDSSGYIFHNLHRVLNDPTEVVLSSSNNPQYLKNKEKGECYIFSKDNFIENDLGCPGYIKLKEDRIEVVVQFFNDFDEKLIHETKSYHIFAK
ncbi:hypothetical protein HGB07_02845 [Candidatus Roizmanbacteria bacterium]|nr:hypothetical protein [Candidatus Roizmanbacteria bacterium]